MCFPLVPKELVTLWLWIRSLQGEKMSKAETADDIQFLFTDEIIKVQQLGQNLKKTIFKKVHFFTHITQLSVFSSEYLPIAGIHYTEKRQLNYFNKKHS